ncbi:MAG: hypothetical protein IPK13_03955 [Deltaproteobacteria bacterium]|nr:hypothetical protein [Deltaproteobacteria bacterium]
MGRASFSLAFPGLLLADTPPEPACLAVVAGRDVRGLLGEEGFAPEDFWGVDVFFFAVDAALAAAFVVVFGDFEAPSGAAGLFAAVDFLGVELGLVAADFLAASLAEDLAEDLAEGLAGDLAEGLAVVDAEPVRERVFAIGFTALLAAAGADALRFGFDPSVLPAVVLLVFLALVPISSSLPNLSVRP